ncbi:heme-dependent oxidative N-demethylase family protein [Ruegeria aquimaris]|uniref:DUF3445 domain-containing protein n=1 Tax=Ruegeria aquimaris TaxID=2984333 RepID=A0ABT3AN67_9RHOB|nr:DUF3445 domain-containing protein [Ruegeria sp. XHP0148]MCV2889546.1 DUF3445 domain-containing protein [Ruegeria sp. XHP0148]
MKEILQKSLPYDVLAPRPLPGIQPLDMADWLRRDEAFNGQMARRDVLIATKAETVLALSEEARPAAEELLDTVLTAAYPTAGDRIQRPDGVTVEVDRRQPMRTLGRLVQEDFCILQKQGDEHVLTAAVLCFPASWTLAEKFGRPLISIHEPVASYDTDVARRVQRLFDGVQVGRPLWRFNALWYADAELHQPRSIHNRRRVPVPEDAGFLRSEKQSILRLPQSQAVVFSIHTYVIARADAPRVPGH